MSLFAVQDALVKLLSQNYSLLQILFVRSAVVIIPLFLVVMYKRGLAGFHTKRKKDHVIRVFYNFTAFLIYYFAISRLPLGDATAIAMSAPLFLTALSGPLLGEPADLKRKLILVVGFFGVLIVIQPDFQKTDWLGVACAVSGAFMFAMLAIQTRKMTATEDTEVMVFFAALAFFIVTGISMFLLWRTPGNQELLIMIGVGCITLFAQYCIVHAYRFAAVYVIAPFEYVVILWALLFGWILFAEIPTWVMLSGCLVIVICGLTLAAIERREHRNTTLSPSPIRETSLT